LQREGKLSLRGVMSYVIDTRYKINHMILPGHEVVVHDGGGDERRVLLAAERRHVIEKDKP
jgi:hypothetical protein